MVKFQRRVSKKRYLNSKRIYKYERISFDIPKRYHRLINDYSSQEFEVNLTNENGVITIILTPRKASLS